MKQLPSSFITSVCYAVLHGERLFSFPIARIKWKSVFQEFNLQGCDLLCWVIPRSKAFVVSSCSIT